MKNKDRIFVELEFESGYETTVDFDKDDFETEYWVKITQCQNPYDASDEPLKIKIDNQWHLIDCGGEWLECLDEFATKELGVEQFYS